MAAKTTDRPPGKKLITAEACCRRPRKQHDRHSRSSKAEPRSLSRLQGYAVNRGLAGCGKRGGGFIFRPRPGTTDDEYDVRPVSPKSLSQFRSAMRDRAALECRSTVAFD